MLKAPVPRNGGPQYQSLVVTEQSRPSMSNAKVTVIKASETKCKASNFKSSVIQACSELPTPRPLSSRVSLISRPPIEASNNIQDSAIEASRHGLGCVSPSDVKGSDKRPPM